MNCFVPRAAAVLVIGSAVVGSASCGGSPDAGRVEAPRPTGRLAGDRELLKGRRVYANYCSACHGISGGGNVGPSFTDGKLLRDFADADAQEAFVRIGRAVMPGFGSQLDDGEIRDVVRYEREVLSKPQRP